MAKVASSPFSMGSGGSPTFGGGSTFVSGMGDAERIQAARRIQSLARGNSDRLLVTDTRHAVAWRDYHLQRGEFTEAEAMWVPLRLQHTPSQVAHHQRTDLLAWTRPLRAC